MDVNDCNQHAIREAVRRLSRCKIPGVEKHITCGDVIVLALMLKAMGGNVGAAKVLIRLADG
jgi:hypothetical protein